MLTLDQLAASIRDGSIDTVVVAFTDMQGRLVGKRLHGSHLVEQDLARRGIEGCNYLLAVDMEMEPVPGYELANWERGYGDFSLRPDLATLRRIPWLPATALVLCDVEWHDGTPVNPSPRQILRRQVERARALGFEPMFGSELEFYVFRESYSEAQAQRHRDLTPSVSYIPDLPHPRIDLRRAAAPCDPQRNGRRGDSRRGLKGRGLAGSARGELPVRGRTDDGRQPRRLQERRQGDRPPARLLAHVHGKPDEGWIGNSCHIHSSLWRDGENAFAGESNVFRHYLAGQIACLAELAVFVAPTVNSYKRFAPGSWAPTTLAWGHDNRTCGFRIVGKDASLRTETRIPGGDVNPYLALAALLAAGLHGIENELPLPPAHDGNAYEAEDAARFPGTLYEAVEALEQGTIARAAFGDDVVDHYLNYARTEQRLFDEAVTDYERARMYERG